MDTDVVTPFIGGTNTGAEKLRYRKYEILEDRCKDCGTCLEECPDKAIKRTENDICEIDEELCSYCGICMEVCQLKAVKKTLSFSTFLKSLRNSKKKRRRNYAREKKELSRIGNAHR